MSRRKPSVLLVDNDAAVLTALQFALEVEGYEVRAYTSAADLEAEAIPPQTDCLVLDYHLEPGADGLGLLARLRRRAVTAPAILITGDARRGVRDAALAAGVQVVEKPFLGDMLMHHVRLALMSAA